jgi:hypothetical protein
MQVSSESTDIKSMTFTRLGGGSRGRAPAKHKALGSDSSTANKKKCMAFTFTKYFIGIRNYDFNKKN